MEQNKKLDDLVNEVDQEARSYVSFDDYLAAKSPIPNPDNIPGLESAKTEQEWKKDAADAEVLSSSSSNAPEGDKVESKPPSSVESASPESGPKEKDWWKEYQHAPKGEPTSKDLRSDPNTVWPEAPYKPVETVPLTETVLEVSEVEWNGQLTTFLHEEEKVIDLDDEVLAIYRKGSDFCAATADVFEVIAHFKDVQRRMKKLTIYLESIHNGIRKKLSASNAETRTKGFNELNRSNRSVAAKNKPAQEKLKQERAPKSNGEPKIVKPKTSPGLKLAESMVANGFPQEMIVTQLRQSSMLDDVTSAFLQKHFTAKGGK